MTAQITTHVASIHQFHGDDCLCGFSSPRSRSRTEHILDAALVAQKGERGRPEVAPSPEELAARVAFSEGCGPDEYPPPWGERGGADLAQRVEAVTYASDDGTEYEHNGHAAWEGEPECPRCWADSIRVALATPAGALAKHGAEVLRAAAEEWPLGHHVHLWLRERADHIAGGQ